MRERKTRIGRPTPRHQTLYLYAPRFPKGWLSPENTGIPWTTDQSSPEWKKAETLVKARDLDYMKAEAREKPQTVPTRDRFEDCVKARLEYLAARVTPNSLHVTRSHLRNACATFGPWKIEKITREQLEAYQVELADAGLSAKTIHDRIGEIRNVLRRAVEDHKLAEVPKVERYVRPPAEDEPAAAESPYIAAPDLDALFAEVRRDLPGLADLAEVRALCGVRTQALATLRWEDVQPGRVVIPIARMKDRRTRTRPYVLPIVADLKRPFTRPTDEPGSLVFHDLAGKCLLGTATGGALSTTAQRTWNAAVAKVLGGVRFEFADLRHCASTRMQEAGLNDLSRRILMAHATGVEGRYVDVEKDARRSLEAVAALVARERLAGRKVRAFA